MTEEHRITRSPLISPTQATEKRLRLTSTYFIIGFSNCLAHLHCRMQDKQYVWLQLERIPNLLSEADGFSYTTSMQILQTLSWLAWKAKAFSMSCSNVAMHICHRRDGIGYCSPRISPFLVKQKGLPQGPITGKTRDADEKHHSYPSLSSFIFKNIKFNHAFQPFNVLCSFRSIRSKAARTLLVYTFPDLCHGTGIAQRDASNTPKPINWGFRMGATLETLLCLSLRPHSFTRY